MVLFRPLCYLFFLGSDPLAHFIWPVSHPSTKIHPTTNVGKQDLASAERLAAELQEYLKDEEIYRVDHYMVRCYSWVIDGRRFVDLYACINRPARRIHKPNTTKQGKTAVQAILPFRHANRDWLDAAVWNAAHVERIEIAMKETEDCEGRTAFYEVRYGDVGLRFLVPWSIIGVMGVDLPFHCSGLRPNPIPQRQQGYGVIRDVLQNHLTQVLCLLKMDLPPASASANAQEGQDDADAAAGHPGVFGSHQHRAGVLKELRLHGGDADSRATSALFGGGGGGCCGGYGCPRER